MVTLNQVYTLPCNKVAKLLVTNWSLLLQKGYTYTKYHFTMES